MKILKEDKFEEYSNEIDKDDIGGSLHKRFIRIDSKFIAKYFDEISKPNSSYQSYADDLIKECYDSKYRDEYGERNLPIKYFSALVKETNGHCVYEGETNEVVCSRLCNLFRIPTVYNEKILYCNEPAVISLDMVKPNEAIFSMIELYGLKYPNENLNAIENAYGEYQTMKDWVSLIKELMEYIISPDAPNREKMIDDICGEFCVQMFFKLLVLCEEDFNLKNISALVSEDRMSARLSPAYDFEYCRFHSYSLISFFINTIDYMKFMQSHYPKKLATLMDNFTKASHYKNGEINPSRIHKIFADNYKEDYLVEDFMKSIIENIRRIDFIYDKFTQGDLDKKFDDVVSLKEEYLNRSLDKSQY